MESDREEQQWGKHQRERRERFSDIVSAHNAIIAFFVILYSGVVIAFLFTFGGGGGFNVITFAAIVVGVIPVVIFHLLVSIFVIQAKSTVENNIFIGQIGEKIDSIQAGTHNYEESVIAGLKLLVQQNNTLINLLQKS